MERILTTFFRPFELIAGRQALGWGLLGMAVSVLITYFHYHGLLQAGSGSNNALWCFAGERLVIWLVPAILFYIGGLILSKSRIRPIDVLGTVAFAQIPMIGFDLVSFFGVFGTVFLVWTLVWMFNALQVSCNLKGWALWVVYLAGVFGGEGISWLINPLFY